MFFKAYGCRHELNGHYVSIWLMPIFVYFGLHKQKIYVIMLRHHSTYYYYKRNVDSAVSFDIL